MWLREEREGEKKKLSEGRKELTDMSSQESVLCGGQGWDGAGTNRSREWRLIVTYVLVRTF